MSFLSHFTGHQNTPPENPTAEVLEKFEKSINGIQRVDQLNHFLSHERNRRRLSIEHVEIIQRRLEALAGEVQTDTHRKTAENCQKHLDDLRRRLGDSSGTEVQQKEKMDGDGSLAGRLGVGVGASLLGFFGLRSIVRHGPVGAAQHAVGGGWRGMLGLGRGTVNTGRRTVGFAWRHPVMAVFMGTMGVGVTQQVRDYFHDNSDALIREIEESARERSIPPAQRARDVGHRIGDYIRSAGSSTLDTFIKGVVTVCGGKIDENGAITLPHSTLRPAFYVAYQAGQRSRFASRKVWRDWQDWIGFRTKESKMLGASEIVGRQSNDRARHLAFLGKEADRLYQTINSPTTTPVARQAAERQLKPILETLNGEMRLQATPGEKTNLANMTEAERKQRLNTIVTEAETVHRNNTTTFDGIKKSILADLSTLEQKIRKGDVPPGLSVQDFKEAELNKIRSRVDAHSTNLEKSKIRLGKEFVDTLNALGTKRMDAAGGGYVDAARRKMENAGVTVATSTKAGSFVLKAAVGYTLLPFFGELASASMNTLEGNVKQKRLEEKLARGERLTENEQKELKRLQNQWQAVGLDAAQIAGGFIPVVGEAMDFKAAITGKDLNGRDLSTLSRVTSGVMGTLGTASLILVPFTGGLSAVGFRAIRGARGAGRALRKTEGIEQSVRAVQKSTNVIEQTRAMATIGTGSQTALKARSAIQTARSGMQVASYSLLGYHLITGAVDFVQTSAQKIAGAKERAAKFAEEEIGVVASHLPSHQPQGQSPSETNFQQAA